ncbi:MAG TPA: ProQ/FINO family protein [Pseudomonadales bacterium]
MTEERPILRLKRPRSTQRAPIVSGGRRGRPTAVPIRPATEDDLLADLQAAAPAVWDPEKPVPLAVGVHTQINPVAENRGLSRRRVRRFLARWTSREAYLQALLEPGAQRRNADGTPAEPVLERHRERARQRLARRQPGCGSAPARRSPQQDSTRRHAG